jgi:hypothetical protein
VIEMATNRERKVRQVQELRRSNAAQPHRNRSRYTRKIKHRATRNED